MISLMVARMLIGGFVALGVGFILPVLLGYACYAVAMLSMDVIPLPQRIARVVLELYALMHELAWLPATVLMPPPSGIFVPGRYWVLAAIGWVVTGLVLGLLWHAVVFTLGGSHGGEMTWHVA